MGATVPHGYPFPVGTDRVMDGDNAIEALAQMIETNLRGGVWSTHVNVPAVPAGTGANLAVTFPVGRFTVAPNVAVVADTGSPGLFRVTVAAVGTTGCTVCAFNSYTAPFDIPAFVIAHQQG